MTLTCRLTGPSVLTAPTAGVVLGVTPHLARCGWALVAGDEALAVGVIRTRSAYGSADAPTDAAGALTRRTRVLAKLLRTVAHREPLVAIVAPPWPAAASPELARAWGVIDAISVELSVEVHESDAPPDLAELQLEADREGWLEGLLDDEIPGPLHRHALHAVALARAPRP